MQTNDDDVTRVDRRGFSDFGDLPRRATSLCACVSEDAERCITLRYPEAPDLTDDGVIERCECSCHDFGSYDE